MSKHEVIDCPRCGEMFECKAGSYLICHCSDIYLTREQTEYLAENWDSCLCHNCLMDIKNNWQVISDLEK